MTRAEKASIAYQLVAHGPRVMGGDAVLSDDDFKFWNINYDFVAGYKQAEKDIKEAIVKHFKYKQDHSPEYTLHWWVYKNVIDKVNEL